jgi:hypothetical protein
MELTKRVFTPSSNKSWHLQLGHTITATSYRVPIYYQAYAEAHMGEIKLGWSLWYP